MSLAGVDCSVDVNRWFATVASSYRKINQWSDYIWIVGFYVRFPHSFKLYIEEEEETGTLILNTRAL